MALPPSEGLQARQLALVEAPEHIFVQTIPGGDG